MKEVRMISACMSRAPLTVDKDSSLSTAVGLLRDTGVRHLPVLDSGRLVGLVSDRDLKWGLTLGDADEIPVERAMTPAPYVVHPNAALLDVVAQMLEKKYGCVVVQAGCGAVIGIFTTTDALRVLTRLLADSENVVSPAREKALPSGSGSALQTGLFAQRQD